LLLLAASLLAAPDPGRPEAAEGELLLPGPPLERPIAAGEAHRYRVAVTDTPLLVTVEQQSIDLVVEDRGPAGEELRVGAGGGRWGPEVLLLERVGEHHIEVHSQAKSGWAWPGRYTISVETLADLSAEGRARQQALAVMSRASQEGLAMTSEVRRQAAASYREALAAWRELGDRRWEAEALSSLALLDLLSDERRPAVEDCEQALALWRELGDPQRQAVALSMLGGARMLTGEYSGAREAFEGALSLWQKLGSSLEEAATRVELCLLEQMVGALPAALACYEKPRAVFREAGYLAGEQTVLNNLGGVYNLLGEPDAALDHYQQALALRRALGDRVLEAQSLNNIAGVHGNLGEWQEALRLLGQAREILAPLGERSPYATVLNNIGSFYTSMGEPQRALAFLEDALKLRREVGNRPAQVSTLNALGVTWSTLGEPEKALDHHRQALELATALGDTRQEAITRLLLGEIELERGDSLATLRELDPALAHFKAAGLRWQELRALHLQARALDRAGRSREALPILQEVLAQRRTLNNRVGEADALQSLAIVQRSLGLHAEACANAEAAVARVEELRTGFVNPDLRAAFLATQRRAYALLIDLLMDRHAADPAGGWDRAAFEVSEQARARSLLDALHSGSAERSGSAVPAGLLERRQSLRRRLSAKADQQVQQTGAQAAALGKEIDALQAELDGVDAEIGRFDPQSAVVRQPRPIDPEEIAGLLDPGTLLLEYALGEERSFLWMVGAGELRSFILPPQR